MPRRPRIFIPGVSLHVIQRGHNGLAIFGDDDDCETFLGLLRSAAERSGLDVHNYALMKTHDHLIVTPHHPDSFERTMRSLGVRYARYFNAKYQRRGTIFNERPKGIHIQDERYLLNCMRYIEQNPVRAAIVSSPAEYRWSSFSILGGGRESDWLVPHYFYRGLGSTVPERCRAYRELCGQPLIESEVLEQRLGTDPGRSQVRPGSVPTLAKSARVSSVNTTDLLAL
jgi:putative transposase